MNTDEEPEHDCPCCYGVPTYKPECPKHGHFATLGARFEEKPVEASVSCEQKARDLLERMGIEDAQSFTAGDVCELANLIATAEFDREADRLAAAYPEDE